VLSDIILVAPTAFWLLFELWFYAVTDVWLGPGLFYALPLWAL
jgi:hypothetical protein